MQVTGELAKPRHSRQYPNGRKDSRDKRVDWLPQLDLSSERSYDVKNASDVLRLECDMIETLDVAGGVVRVSIELDIGMRFGSKLESKTALLKSGCCIWKAYSS